MNRLHSSLGLILISCQFVIATPAALKKNIRLHAAENEAVPGKDGRRPKQDEKAPALVRQVGISLDGRLAFSGDSEGVIRVWDVAKRKLLRTIPDPTTRQKTFASYAFSANGELALVAKNRGPTHDPNLPPDTLSLWDLRSGKKIRDLEAHGQPIGSIALSPDGTRALSVNQVRMGVFMRSGNRQHYPIFAVRLWDTATGKVVQSLLEECTCTALPIAFSEDGKICAVGHRGGTAAGFREKPYEKGWDVKLWDAARGLPIRALEGNDKCDVNTLRFSPSGKELALGTCHSVQLRSLKTGRTIWVHSHETEGIVLAPADNWSIRSIAFSRDGKYIVSAGNETDYLIALPRAAATGGTHLLDAATGRKVKGFVGSTEWVRSVIFTPNGAHLLGATPRGIRFWHKETGAISFTLEQ